MSKASYEWKMSMRQRNRLHFRLHDTIFCSWHEATLKEFKCRRRWNEKDHRNKKKKWRNWHSSTKHAKPMMRQWLYDPHYYKST